MLFLIGAAQYLQNPTEANKDAAVARCAQYGKSFDQRAFKNLRRRVCTGLFGNEVTEDGMRVLGHIWGRNVFPGSNPRFENNVRDGSLRGTNVVQV